MYWFFHGSLLFATELESCACAIYVHYSVNDKDEMVSTGTLESNLMKGIELTISFSESKGIPKKHQTSHEKDKTYFPLNPGCLMILIMVYQKLPTELGSF